MKKLLFLLLLIPFLGTSQGTFTAPVGYNTGAPTAAPSGVGTRWRFDLLTGRTYKWSPTAASWVVDGYGIDNVSGCVPPAYTPTYGQSIFAANGCDSLYMYRAGHWRHLNPGGGGGGSNISAGAGITISGTPPDLTINADDISAENELNTALYVDAGSLVLDDAGGSVSVPLSQFRQGIYNAGTGISINSGTGAISNTGDLSATNEIQALSIDGSDLTLSNGGGTVTLPSGGGGADSYQADLIYSTNYYSNTSDFTAVNTTPVAQNGYIRLSGGDGSLNNYLKLNVTPITDENIIVTATYRMSGSTSVNGMGIGLRSVNTWYPVSVYGVFVPNNNSLAIYQANTATKVSETFLSYTPALGDVLKLTYVHSKDQGSLIFEDITQKKITAINAYDNHAVGSAFLVPNTCVPVVHSFSGTIDLLSLSCYSLSKSPYIAVIGDSKSKGVAAGSTSLRYPALLSSLGNTQVFSGNGDRTVEIAQSVQRIAAKSPTYAILNLGRNDLASSVSSSTWQANYTAIVDSLESAGVDVIHLLPIPENSGLNQSTLRSWILSNYPGQTVDTTGFIRATMVSSNNIHPNELGYKQIAKNIAASGLITPQTDKTAQQEMMPDVYRYLPTLLSGSGTSDYIPRFTGSGVLGNSGASDNGTLFTFTRPLSITSSTEDKITLKGSNSPVIRFTNSAGSDYAILQASAGFARFYVYGNIPVVLATNNKNVFSGSSTSVEIGNTAGFGYDTGAFIRGFNNLSTGYSLLCSPSTVSKSTSPLSVNNVGQVGIGTDAPPTSAKLEIVSTTQGFLPPRMTTAQRNAISSPATGLTLYCTDCTATDSSTGVMQTYNGSIWKNNW